MLSGRELELLQLKLRRDCLPVVIGKSDGDHFDCLRCIFLRRRSQLSSV